MLWVNRYKLVVNACDRENRMMLKSLTDEEAGRLFKALMDIDPFPDSQRIAFDPDDPADENLTAAPKKEDTWYWIWKKLARESLEENRKKWKIQSMIRSAAQEAYLYM